MNRSGRKFNPGVQLDKLKTILPPEEIEAFRFYVSGSRANEGIIPDVRYRRGGDSSDTDLTIVVPDGYEEAKVRELNNRLQTELQGTGLDIQVVKKEDQSLVEADLSQEIKIFNNSGRSSEAKG